MKARTVESIEIPVGLIGKTGSTNIVDRACRRLWSLQSKALCARARHRTGLKDFGDPPIDEPLSVLTESLEHEADLHPLGRWLMRGHLLEMLETRLRLRNAWENRLTDLEAIPIDRPAFITGMPRSGSTFLHELLAQDPGNRVPRVWEVMFPHPIAPLEKDPGLRARRAAARLWWFRRFVPQADSVHPLRAGMPQECIAIHSYTFMSEEFVSTCRVPTYQRYLRSTGLGPAYEWQKRFLQHLQSGCSPKRWVLKAPDHLVALEELFSVFPDAIVVQMHRNPLEVLKSAVQLSGALRRLFGRPEGASRLEDHEATALAEQTELSIRFRDRHPELGERFIDLNYSEVISDPLMAVHRIYARLGQPLTEVVIQRMRQFISTRGRYKRHSNPSLADLGIDVRAEIRRFQGYCLRFGIPCAQPDRN